MAWDFRLNLVLFIGVLILLALESLFPYFNRPNNFKKRFKDNWIVFFINGIVINLILFPLIIASTSFNFGIFHYFTMPSWLEIILTIVLFDLSTYWIHVAFHQVPFLWKFHRVHHTDNHLDISTAGRFHVVEHCILFLGRCLLFLVFGMSLEYVMIAWVSFVASAFFHHGNFSIGERWDKIMRSLITSPQMHKVHHSKIKVEMDTNYSSLFSFWDRIFGTFKIMDFSKINYGSYDKKEEGLKEMFLSPFRKD